MTESDLSPVPESVPEGVRQRLLVARRIAVDLLRHAEDLEAEARDVRRKARARLKHYENLLDEYNGQLSVLDEEGVFDARSDLR